MRSNRQTREAPRPAERSFRRGREHMASLAERTFRMLTTALLSMGFSHVATAQVALEGEATSLPERHQVADGETLSSVAERYLGDGDAWPKLWSYNPEITNPHWIYPGYVLRLKTGTGEQDTSAGANGGITAGKPLSRFSISRGRSLGDGTVLLGEEVYLDRDALKQAARIVGSSEDHLMLSPTDEVYLQFKEQGSAPTVGKELTVFYRLQRAEVSPKAGKLKTYPSEGGEIVRVIGALKIKNYDAEKRIARATVTESLDPIERGFEVADVPRRLAKVPVKKSARALQMKILAATRPLGTLGDSQLVFLNAGQKQGLEVGNRVWVVRQGDPWRQQLHQRPDLTGAERPDDVRVADDKLPEETVGELRVLYVRPETATALITNATIELSPGERVETRAGY
jgi:hypothetical protein